MLETANPLPEHIVLNGADYFCLQLDRLMWQTSGKRNVCVLVVTLAERLALADLQQQLDQRPAYQWLCRLRLREGLPFSLAQWVYEPKAAMPVVSEYPLAASGKLPDGLLSGGLDIKKQAPFKIDLLQSGDAGSVLVFTWHHVLMDAHGGELFIRYLGMPPAVRQASWVAPEEPKLPLKVRGKIASDMKQFLYDTSSLPLLSLYKSNLDKPQACYRVLSFTPQQTLMVNGEAKRLDAGFLPSAFYLAATTYAVAQVQKKRGEIDGDALVPVPVDRRKRGAPGAILGNQVSFLFYRLPKAILEDVPAMTGELMTQMKALMRAESPAHYTVMMDFLRRLPGFIYRRVLKAPTQGLMASFFYSDTGDSLQDFTGLFGQPVKGAVHYPPNMYPPGLTFIFSRYQGALQITLSYMHADLTEFEAQQLLATVHSVLLGDKG
ncbi:hypothetical protein [Methylovulum psychrotolerans]|uniref:Condensation domain-containing protein n=1 Tax=Methylovulum psychrotolerans TaxID=1704499 RepID=A0A2S5CGV9_9GAMM|nr:hypothetical protein [Methylovulum psychrotolerans]POZ50050.1 hypothetical protein AADEFJLK_04174 [Methylovulum psychrotolerans]